MNLLNSESCQQFQVQQTRCQFVGDGICVIGEVFDELVRNGIAFVDDIENFQA